MGFVLIIGMMLYSVGLCHVLQRFGQHQPGVRAQESEWNRPSALMVVPDRVPVEWVDAYRAEQGG